MGNKIEPPERQARKIALFDLYASRTPLFYSVPFPRTIADPIIFVGSSGHSSRAMRSHAELNTSVNGCSRKLTLNKRFRGNVG
jgi:hypothetical protein